MTPAAIRQETWASCSRGSGSDLQRVFEVRDKPVAAPEVRRFVRKVSEARIDRAGIISVASARSNMTPELFDFSTRGVTICAELTEV